MFNRASLISIVNNGNIAEALGILRGLDKTTIDQVDKKTNTTMLHHLAQCEELNIALQNGNQDAIDLLDMLIEPDQILMKEKTTGRTAFLIAVMSDCRYIAASILNQLISLRLNNLSLELCLTVDKQKKTPLHYAITNANHELIDRILSVDENKKIYFAKDKDGLFSLALAISEYRNNPSELTISIVNQLYFTLPKGIWRTRAVEEKVYMGWGVTGTDLWRYGLRFCAKRDQKNKITTIDLNLVDFINQVCKDGLYVWGFEVTPELIFNYSRSFSETPGEMLRDAFKKLEDGLPGRTLGQARENTTLARKKEFMQRAKLSEASYWISHQENDPRDEMSSLDSDTAHIVLFNDKLFYIPMAVNKESRQCIEIKVDELAEKEQMYFSDLVKSIKALTALGIKADKEDLKRIVAIVPLTKWTADAEVPLIPTVNAGRGVGMTFFNANAGQPGANNNAGFISRFNQSSNSNN